MEHRNLFRYLGKQPNLIVNQESIRKNLIGRNHVSRSPLVELGQNRIKEERSQERRNKEIRRISGKLKDQKTRKLTFTAGNNSQKKI
jgi:hypothetical protein